MNEKRKTVPPLAGGTSTEEVKKESLQLLKKMNTRIESYKTEMKQQLKFETNLIKESLTKSINSIISKEKEEILSDLINKIPEEFDEVLIKHQLDESSKKLVDGFDEYLKDVYFKLDSIRDSISDNITKQSLKNINDTRNNLNELSLEISNEKEKIATLNTDLKKTKDNLDNILLEFESSLNNMKSKFNTKLEEVSDLSKDIDSFKVQINEETDKNIEIFSNEIDSRISNIQTAIKNNLNSFIENAIENIENETIKRLNENEERLTKEIITQVNLKIDGRLNVINPENLHRTAAEARDLNSKVELRLKDFEEESNSKINNIKLGVEDMGSQFKSSTDELNLALDKIEKLSEENQELKQNNLDTISSIKELIEILISGGDDKDELLTELAKLI